MSLLGHISASESIIPASPRARRVALAGLGAALLVAVAAALLAPTAAHAEIPVVGPVIHAIGKVGHAVLHPVDAVVEGFVKLLQAIFGGIEAKFITGVISGLLTIPNFDNGHIASLEQTSVAISAGMLSAVLTLSIVRYYLAGLADHASGGFEALQALSRLAGAVGFIILWPGIFDTVVQVPRMFNAALLGSGSVQHNVALLFDGALVVGTGAFGLGTGIGLIFVILIGLTAAVVFIALLWMKILLSVLLMFLYVGTPLATGLWPVPEFSWLLSAAMKTLFVVLIVPCVWAILFALSSAINTDVLTWVPTHSAVDTVLVRPLAGITLMILCLTIPRFLLRTAMIGPHSQPRGGRLWRTVAGAALGARVATGGARSVAAAAADGNPGAQRMIDALPSPIRPPSGPGQGNLPARMVFGRSGFGASAAAGNGSSSAGGANGSAEAAEATGKQGAEDALGRARDGMSVPGIERPDFDWRTVNTAGQNMHAASRLAPSSAGQVAAAMAEFPAETQHGLAQFNAANPTKLREFAAQHLHSPSLSPKQRDALVTLGSARGEAVEVGMHQAMLTVQGQEKAQGSQGAPEATRRGPSASLQPAVEPQPGGAPGAPTGAPSQAPASRSRDVAGPSAPQPILPPPASGSGDPGPASPPNRGLPDDPPDPEPFLD